MTYIDTNDDDKEDPGAVYQRPRVKPAQDVFKSDPSKEECFSLKDWIKNVLKHKMEHDPRFKERMQQFQSVMGREKIVALYNQCKEELTNGTGPGV